MHFGNKNRLAAWWQLAAGIEIFDPQATMTRFHMTQSLPAITTGVLKTHDQISKKYDTAQHNPDNGTVHRGLYRWAVTRETKAGIMK